MGSLRSSKGTLGRKLASGALSWLTLALTASAGFQRGLCLQEGEPAGSGVLQLVVTDRDTPRNGAPFSFHIVSGNQERRFQVDQGGLLSLSAPLSRKDHRLKIQVGSLGSSSSSAAGLRADLLRRPTRRRTAATRPCPPSAWWTSA